MLSVKISPPSSVEMDLMQILLAIIVSVATFVWLFYKYKFSYWERRGVLHDKPVFPYGSIAGVGTVIHSAQLMQQIYTKFKGKDRIAGLYTIFSPSAVVLDPELFKNILIKDFAYFDERGTYYNEKDDPISAHLFALNGEKWKPLRAKLTPTFTSGKMKFMFSTMTEVADRLRECLRSMVDANGELMEIKDILARFTTDMIGSCAFGVECDSLKDPDSAFRNAGRDVFAKPRHSRLAFILFTNFTSIANFLRIKAISDHVSEFFMKTVKDNVKYREENNVTRNDFMDILIKLRKETNSLTIDEIAAQAFVFFLAGFETSSTALAYCLYELSQLPEVQEKVRQNIREVTERHGKLTYEAVMEMDVVEQAINGKRHSLKRITCSKCLISSESMRKYPPVPTLTRRTQRDYKVPGTNHVLEKGTLVWLPIFAIQNDPEFFPEPEKFKLERFTPEEIAKRGPNKWLPFGEGPRNCIGLRFGMMQAKIGLATLLDNFEFSLSEKTPIPLEIQPLPFILASVGGVYLQVKRIK